MIEHHQVRLKEKGLSDEEAHDWLHTWRRLTSETSRQHTVGKDADDNLRIMMMSTMIYMQALQHYVPGWHAGPSGTVSRWVSYITHSPVMLTPLPRPLAPHLGRQMGLVNDWTTCARPPLVSAEKTSQSLVQSLNENTPWGNGIGENGSRNEPS